jgi:hypothetical protein
MTFTDVASEYIHRAIIKNSDFSLMGRILKKYQRMEKLYTAYHINFASM